jgi:hypothetical protein
LQYYLHSCLKSGVACPIRKKGKPKQDPNLYRKITITTLLGKIIEKIHLNLNSVNVSNQQNRLQKGFTRGEMPITADATPDFKHGAMERFSKEKFTILTSRFKSLLLPYFKCSAVILITKGIY